MSAYPIPLERLSAPRRRSPQWLRVAVGLAVVLLASFTLALAAGASDQLLRGAARATLAAVPIFAGLVTWRRN